MEQSRLNKLRSTRAFRAFATCMRIRTIATAIVLMAGCGDGDAPTGAGPDSPDVLKPPSQEVHTGVLTAPATAGVSYETSSLSGATDEDGSFEYREGESVRFFLGDTTLGETAGAAEVTVFDLAKAEPLTTGVRGFREARKEVSRTANIATLLQTFDYDGDPSNGIEITQEVAAFFDGVEVDLGRDIFDFWREPTFRSILNLVNEHELLEDYRRPRGGIAVMDTLYAELDLTPGFFAPTSTTVDEDGDGSIDRLREFAHEAQQSRVAHTKFDSNVGRKLVTTDFDEYGNAVSEVEVDEDGDIVASERSVSDLDGNIVLTSYDLFGDGVIESSTAMSYDEFGGIRRRESDRDADGTPETIATYGYDERGNQNRFEWDSDANGSPERIDFLTFDDDRNLVTFERDEDGDAWFETIEVYDYDISGRLLGRALFPTGQTSPLRLRVWTYDASGLLTQYSEDEDGDGVIDSVVHYEYDPDGRETAERTDDDGDGEIDRIRTSEYDVSGDLARYDYDLDADGSADHAVSYAYDVDGNRTLEEIDNGADGVPDEIVRHSYAPTGWGYLFYELREDLVVQP